MPAACLDADDAEAGAGGTLGLALEGMQPAAMQGGQHRTPVPKQAAMQMRLLR
jgi:hypothetical protein